MYSRTRASAENVADAIPYEVAVHTDLDAVLADESIEAVDIVLPIPVLPGVVRQALEAGKHVLSEKPIAPTVAEGKALVAHSRSFADQVWMVGENWRYEGAFQAAAEAIRAGRIGRPVFCDVSLQLPIKAEYQGSSWRNSGAFPGGYLLDGGVHHVAGLRVLLGEIESVCALPAVLSARI